MPATPFGNIAVLRLRTQSGFGEIERQGGVRKAGRQHLEVHIPGPLCRMATSQVLFRPQALSLEHWQSFVEGQIR